MHPILVLAGLLGDAGNRLKGPLSVDVGFGHIVENVRPGGYPLQMSEEFLLDVDLVQHILG